MAKWKCEICGNEFDNFHAQGFDNKIYCPLCYFKKENQELKLQLKGTTHCFDEEEHEKLKKQLEEKSKEINRNKTLNFINKVFKENTKLENQQKEFINYINSYIELLKNKPDLVEEGQKDILEEILSKYKEITGQQDGQVSRQV